MIGRSQPNRSTYLFPVPKAKRLIRIELTLEAWKASVLPLNYRRTLSRRSLQVTVHHLTQSSSHIRVNEVGIVPTGKTANLIHTPPDEESRII